MSRPHLWHVVSRGVRGGLPHAGDCRVVMGFMRRISGDTSQGAEWVGSRGVSVGES